MIVLLVDADFAVLKELRRMVIEKGCTPVLATDTDTALARIATHDPYLIVVNFTGVRALHSILKATSAIIVAMSASVAHRRKTFDARRADGARLTHGFLYKPDLREFSTMLDRTISFATDEVQHGA